MSGDVQHRQFHSNTGGGGVVGVDGGGEPRGGGGSRRTKTERVWKLVISGGESTDSVGGNFFERLLSPVVGSTFEIEPVFGNEAFPSPSDSPLTVYPSIHPFLRFLSLSWAPCVSSFP